MLAVVGQMNMAIEGRVVVFVAGRAYVGHLVKVNFEVACNQCPGPDIELTAMVQQWLFYCLLQNTELDEWLLCGICGFSEND